MSNLSQDQVEHRLGHRKVMSEQVKLDTRYETNRQKILDEAYHIVLHQGIDQLSMRSIATAVKSSPANLYEYFTSKDEIVYELHAKLLHDLASHLKAVDSQLPPDEYLEQLGIAYLEFAQRHSALFKLYGHYNVEANMAPRSSPYRNDENGHHNQTPALHTLFDLLHGAIQRQLAVQNAPADGVRATSHEQTMAFWAMIHGYATLMWLAVRPDYSIVTWRRLYRQFFIAV
jgi:AcrR family transcriptional regulator